MPARTIVIALTCLSAIWVGYRWYFSSPFEDLESLVEQKGKLHAAEIRIRLTRCAVEEGHAIAGAYTFERQSECDALFDEAGGIVSVEAYAIQAHNSAVEYCYKMRGVLDQNGFDACLQRAERIGAALR